MLTRLSPRRGSPLRRAGQEFIAFCLVDRAGEPTVWIRCGSARVNRDGSIHVQLDALPINGELHLRPVEVGHLPLRAVDAPSSSAPAPPSSALDS